MTKHFKQLQQSPNRQMTIMKKLLAPINCIKIEGRVNLKFLLKLRKSVSGSYKTLQRVYRDNFLSFSCINVLRRGEGMLFEQSP